MKKLTKKKNVKKKNTTTLDTFYLAFIGEHIKLSGSFSTPNGNVISGISGYLLDTDKEYYFLGDDAEAIKVAVKKDAVFAIETIELKDELTVMLDNFDIPDDKEHHN